MELNTIYQTGTFDTSTGDYNVEYTSPFIDSIIFVIMLSIGIFAFVFFFRLWR